MCDGIETTENMTRCMSNNYSPMDFWRNWHRSFNRWMVRYLYVPLGGKKYYVFSIFPIFTFVAVWHDIELRLLYWGWLIALFIIPEVVATRLFCGPKIRAFLGDWHLHICAIGAVGNIFMMMTANLIGFAVGLDGMIEMFGQLFKLDGKAYVILGLIFIVSVCGGLFTGAHCMFWEAQKNAVESNKKSID